VKGFRRDVRVVNLSLLNTDWYIWQLKHRPPQVPVSIADEQLPLLQPMRARDGRVLYVRDIAMYDIINTTAFRRPIYFAVTVPGLEEMGLLDHLVLEGLVFRLVPEKKVHMDLDKTEENMWEKYRYRGLLTPDGRLDRAVYRDPNTTSLVTNYSAAYIQLALEYMRRGDYARAVRDAERAGEISPGYAPYLSLMGPLYAEAGDFLKAEEFLQRRLAQDPRDGEAHLHLGYTFEREGRTEEAMESYRRAIELDPNLSEAYRRLAGQLFRLGRTDEAAGLLEKWLELHPEDTGTARTLQELRQEGAGTDSNRPPARAPVLRKVSPPPRATVPSEPH
jgi:predicted Zn-dependent protease